MNAQRSVKRHLLLLLGLALFGCDDGGGGGTTAIDAELPPPNVPYVGQIPELPAGTELNPEDSFPLPAGGVWRFRKKSSELENLPPVTEGGEVVVRVIPRAAWDDHLTPEEAAEMEAEGELLLTRKSHLIVDAEAGKARRTITEALIWRPQIDVLGPRVRVKRMLVEERLLEPAEGQDELVYSVDRVYLPAYILVEDTLRVGQFSTEITNDKIRLTETIIEAGEPPSDPRSGLITLSVQTTPGRGTALPIEGQYREPIHKIQVFDDFLSQQSRTYWVQKGVGPVQWQFRAARNTTFTLTETNLERAVEPDPADAGVAQ